MQGGWVRFDWRAAGQGWLRRIGAHTPDWIRRLSTVAIQRFRAWWREVLAFVGPFVLLAVMASSPDIRAVVRADASLGSVAAVQGAVTGLSLIALVLVVELARRQEDRDDTVYEIMLHTAWIRPTFTFAVAALVATLTAMALSDLAPKGSASNLLVCAYFLTASVAVALLATVWRTVYVLRPTGIVEHRFTANERERRERVSAYIAGHRYDGVGNGESGHAVHVERAGSLIATDRLFVEVEDALRSHQSSRLRWALDRLRALIEASAHEIAAVEHSTPYFGRARHGAWFPLDAIEERLYEFWRAASDNPEDGHVREMWSFQRWLVDVGVEWRSAEILELGLRSGLAAYEAAGAPTGRRRSDWFQHLQENWSELAKLESIGEDDGDRESSRVAVRLATYLQELGGLLIARNDPASFADMFEAFRHTFDTLKRSWRQRHYEREVRDEPQFELFEQVVLSMLAMCGRVMLIGERLPSIDAAPFAQPIIKMLEGSAPVRRYLPAVFDFAGDVQWQWGSWKYEDSLGQGHPVVPWQSEQYALLPLLAQLVSERPSTLSSIPEGFAERVQDTWMRHADTVCAYADAPSEDMASRKEEFSELLAAAVSEEKLVREKHVLSSPLDPERVGAYVEQVRDARRYDQALEYYFGASGRVCWRTESAPDVPSAITYAWLARRDMLVVDASVHSYANEAYGFGFEPVLFRMLWDLVSRGNGVTHVRGTAPTDLLPAIDSVLDDLGCQIGVIVMYGQWDTDDLGRISVWFQRGVDDDLLPLAMRKSYWRRMGAYRGHPVLRAKVDGEPAILVLDLESWGWCVRSTERGERLDVVVTAIEGEEAKRLVDQESTERWLPSYRAYRLDEFMRKVRVRVTERTSFQVENADAARIIRVAASSDDSGHNAA